MWPIITDKVVWSICCLSVTIMSPAKTTEPIAMLFGLQTVVGPMNHVLDGGPDNPMRSSNFEEQKRQPIVKYRDTLP